MRSLRKALGSFVASVIACASLMAVMNFPVSAYDSCDVDRDGYVGTTDLINVSKYLNGIFSVTNYNQLDVNGSLTVDAADFDCVSAALIGETYNAGYYSKSTNQLIPFPAVNGFTSDFAASRTSALEYRRYSYKENTELEPYSLTPVMGTLNSGVNSRAIIGNDDRYLAIGEENTGIVNIELSVGNKIGHGTGFIVGDHQIATSAHCLYDAYDEHDNLWYPITSITMYNKDGTLSNVTLTPVEAHIPERYTDWGNYCYDYALITVEEDLSDEKNYNCTFFSIGNAYNITESDYENIPIYITGCPGKINNIDNTVLYSAQGNVTDENIANGFLIHCNIDGTDGQSGSPMYAITKRKIDEDQFTYVYTVLGIYRGGNSNYSVGPLMTKYHLQFYHNNPNMNY